MEFKMDENSKSKKASSGLYLSKGSGLSLRDTSINNRDQTTTTHVCSRLGCGSRMSSSNTPTPIRTLNKAKSAKQPSQLSTNGKRVAGGSSSKQQPSPLSISSVKKPVVEGQRKPVSSQPDNTVLESQKLRDKALVSQLVLPTTPKSSQSRLKLPQNQVSGQFFYREVNNSSSSSTTTPQSRIGKKVFAARELSDHTTSPSTSSPSASAPFRTGSYAAARNGASTSRSIYRRCNSISGNPGPSGCSSSSSPSSSQSSHSATKEVVSRKRNSETESTSSSSAKGKRLSSGGTFPDDKKVVNAANRSGSGTGISISDTRRARNLTSLRRESNDNRSGGGGVGALVRTNDRPRSARTNRLNEQENNRNRLVRRTGSSSNLGRRLTVPVNDNDTSNTGSESDLVYQSSVASSSGLTATIDSILGDRSTTAPFEMGSGGRSSTNRENLRLYNFDGITEMLLALERIEQNEELSYEQLVVLESNLFLGGGLSFHDQHREMRLDIDNMSYEELLALEEKIGIVSTALTEEALEKCVEKGLFQSSNPSEAASTASEGKVAVDGEADDHKCCVCQEEYVDGDEVGRLGCEHRYHVECVYQWLRLKNWCPICKVEVLQQHSEESPAAERPSSAPSSSELLL